VSWYREVSGWFPKGPYATLGLFYLRKGDKMHSVENLIILVNRISRKKIVTAKDRQLLLKALSWIGGFPVTLDHLPYLKIELDRIEMKMKVKAKESLQNR
jgi:hypothetical protein